MITYTQLTNDTTKSWRWIMNKLYSIRLEMSNGYLLQVFNFWNKSEAVEKMEELSGWTFTEIENNDIHTVWRGV